MHHKRIVIEKNKLVTDLRRLQKHFDTYEPTLRELRRKYEVAMKEKMLIRLERDRVKAKVEGLEGQVRFRSLYNVYMPGMLLHKHIYKYYI